MTDDQLRWIGDEVEGVARYGIQALRAAAEIADERDYREILNEDIEDSYQRAQRAIRKANPRSLPFHHQVLYAIIQEGGEITGGDLHDRYDELKESVYFGTDLTPIERRGRRDKLAKLKAYDLIDHHGTGRNSVYTAVDASIDPLFDLNEAVVRSSS